MLKAEVVYTVLGRNKWSLTRADTTKRRIIHFKVSSQLPHSIKNTRTKFHKSYKAHYLEMDKFVAIEKRDRVLSCRPCGGGGGEQEQFGCGLIRPADVGAEVRGQSQRSGRHLHHQGRGGGGGQRPLQRLHLCLIVFDIFVRALSSR